ncbi:MAG: PAS domain-containing sensor histidine kinase [Methanomicrobiales archaeon]
MTVSPRPSSGPHSAHEHLLHRHIAKGIRVHHIILTIAFLLLIILGGYFIVSQSHAVARTAITSYQQIELEIVRDAARSTREYVYVQTVVLNRTDIGQVEQEILRKFIDPIHLLENGDAWIYAPDHVVFDRSSDFPDAYRNKSMAEIFTIQKGNGASHYEEMTDDVMHAREGVGYYIWLPEKGDEIAAWTPVTIGNFTWTIGLSTPLSEIMAGTGTQETTHASAYLFAVGILIALILFLSWLRADIRRWQSEEILHESEERYSAIVNNAPGPVLIIKEGRLIFINDAGIRASGYPKEELAGKKILGFLTQESIKTTLEAMHRRTKGIEQISEYEAEFIRKDGEIIQLIVRAIDITYQGEMATLALLVDFTDRKRADEALRMANRKLSLLSGISHHDILNQLTVLIGYLELSKGQTADPRLLEYIRKETEVADNITDLIRFTRDYQDIGIQSPSWQDLETTIVRVTRNINPGAIRLEVEVGHIGIYADPLLERVFYNLMENALRYGWTLTRIRFSTISSDKGGIIVCEDDGVGIPEGEKENIFKRKFFHHTGLGMYLSREILAITGMTITENGEAGKGARFEITVPAEAWKVTGKE